MQTYFDQVDNKTVALWAKDFTPDDMADFARKMGEPDERGVSRPISATTAALASIRARGNWMLVNGQWHKRV